MPGWQALDQHHKLCHTVRESGVPVSQQGESPDQHVVVDGEQAKNYQSKYSPRQRRQALLVLGGIVVVLLAVYFGDTLSGLIPRAPYQPQPVVTGGYHVQMALNTTHPQVDQPLHARFTVTNVRGQPITGARVTYQWAMPTMIMDPINGQADDDAPAGTYAADLMGTMSGSWQLLVTVHSSDLPDGTATFDVPVSA